MIRKITILSTCTNRKRALGDNLLSLSNYAGVSWEKAAQEWLSYVYSSSNGTRLARDRYAGMHWKETLACEQIIKNNGIDCDLWVLSAGMGLIPSNYGIPYYSATFTSGVDSIHQLLWNKTLQLKEQCALWWKNLNTHRGNALPSSILEIPGIASEENCIIVICSPNYLFAIEDELCRLGSVNPNYIVFCGGITSNMSAVQSQVHEHIIPFDERFKTISKENNGVNAALNAIMARWILNNYFQNLLNSPLSIIDTVSTIANDLSPVVKKKIIPLSDAEIINFIKVNLAPTSSATSLLHLLREKEGKSCEQKRFGRLFKMVKNKIGGDKNGNFA